MDETPQGEDVKPPWDGADRREDPEDLRSAWKRARRLKHALVEDIAKKVVLGALGLSVMFAAFWVGRVESYMTTESVEKAELRKTQLVTSEAVLHLTEAFKKLEDSDKDSGNQQTKILVEMERLNGHVQGLRQDVQRLQQRDAR